AEASFSPDTSGVDAYVESLVPHRDRFRAMLGVAPPDPTENPAPRFEQIGEDRHAVIYRTWVEVLDGVEV
ncbi:MAG: hypothetical protein QF749_14240, partial [Verrucomicrobiota bacterium]|nr:hypothetical protein [Verrucomicrobiota bacterium]